MSETIEELVHQNIAYKAENTQLRRYIDTLHEEMRRDHSETKTFSEHLRSLPDPKRCKNPEWRIAELQPMCVFDNPEEPLKATTDMRVVPFYREQVNFNNDDHTAYFKSNEWVFFKEPELKALVGKVQDHSERFMFERLSAVGGEAYVSLMMRHGR